MILRAVRCALGVFAAVVGLSACSPGGGANTLDAGATLGGSFAFPVVSVATFYRGMDDGGWDVTQPTVLFIDKERPCSDLKNTILQGSKFLALQRYLTDGGSSARTFPVKEPGVAVMFGESYTDGGRKDLGSPGSGYFEFLTLGPEGITGTMDITFTNTGTVTGSFSAPYCGVW